MRTSLKVRLPKALFLFQAKKFYADWLQQHQHTPKEEQPKFSNQWVKGWKLEHGVSLRHPNKRYSISKENSSIRVQDYLKNIWNVRHYFITKFGMDPPIINVDQMLLLRNESSRQATLSFKNCETFVKENRHLSRERVTVFFKLLVMKISSLSQNLCLKALANVHRSSCHLQEHTINGLAKFLTV